MSTARTTRLSRCRRTSVRLLSASGAASAVLASFLLGALDFALVKATTTPRRVEPFGLLEVEQHPPDPERDVAAPGAAGGIDGGADGGVLLAGEASRGNDLARSGAVFG
jgi:hypothetical protein